MTRIWYPIVDGVTVMMNNISKMTEAEAAKYCINKFGAHRFGGFKHDSAV